MATQMRRRPWTTVLAALATTALVVSCGGGAQPAPTQLATAAPTVAAQTAAATKAAPTPLTLPKPEKATIKIGTTATAANTFAARYALDAGTYKKHGLDVEVLKFQGTAGTTALLAGQIDVLRGSDEAAFFSQKTNTPVMIIASFYNRFLDAFVTAKDVKTAADLKGKRIGTSTFGAFAHRESLAALKTLGLTAKDVQFVEVGGDSARTAALRAGSIQGIVTDESNAEKLKAEGFNVMVKLSEDKQKQALGPIIVGKKFAQDNPNTVLAVTAAMLEATQLMYTGTAKATEALVAWQQSKPADAEAELKGFLSAATRDFMFDEDGVKNFQEFLILQDPTVAQVNIKDTYSLIFLQRLKDMGFMKQVGVPGY